MKKKYIIIIVIIAVLLTGAIYVFDSVFPKAPPIEDVLGKMISVESDSSADQDLFSKIESAKRTRRMSVNDTPSLADYKTVTVNAQNGSFVCFLYEEYGKTYIEFPYIGIYEVK